MHVNLNLSKQLDMCVNWVGTDHPVEESGVQCYQKHSASCSWIGHNLQGQQDSVGTRMKVKMRVSVKQHGAE